MAAPATEPIVRTRLNVEAADALLVVTDGAGSQGTDAAIRHARGHARPVQVCDLGTEPNPAEIATFCSGFGRVNVAGPRRSELAGGRAAEERIENLFLKSFQRLLR